MMAKKKKKYQPYTPEELQNMIMYSQMHRTFVDRKKQKKKNQCRIKDKY